MEEPDILDKSWLEGFYRQYRIDNGLSINMFLRWHGNNHDKTKAIFIVNDLLPFGVIEWMVKYSLANNLHFYYYAKAITFTKVKKG